MINRIARVRTACDFPISAARVIHTCIISYRVTIAWQTGRYSHKAENRLLGIRDIAKAGDILITVYRLQTTSFRRNILFSWTLRHFRRSKTTRPLCRRYECHICTTTHHSSRKTFVRLPSTNGLSGGTWERSPTM